MKRSQGFEQNDKKIVHFSRQQDSNLKDILFLETRKLNREKDLWVMLDKYKHVILKPVSLKRDSVIIHISINSNNRYNLQYGDKSLEFISQREAFSHLKRKMKEKPHLIQQYIEFAKVRNHPFDLIVKVEMNEETQSWIVTEKYAKLRGSINLTLLTVDEALAHLDLAEEVTDKIEDHVLKVVRKMEEATFNRKNWELNLGIDLEGKIWMIKANPKPNQIRGQKQNVYTILKDDKFLSSFLPETVKLKTENDLWMLLDKYKKVILKPIFGRGGIGVIKVSKNSSGHYHIQHNKERVSFHEKKQTFSYLKEQIKSKSYLVQQYIDLTRIRKCPFDLRVIVQRERETSEWNVTGKYAKLAQKGYITTNLSTKAEVLAIEEALQQSNLNSVNIAELLADVDEVALKVAQKLSEISIQQYIWGLDMGIDSNGRIWIIEANSKPGTKGFRQLDDKSMYKMIRKYKQS
ncbi:YheC/YheD family protein [Metabacillus fastidiosus]|uniref:YheC/YheD family protein n=1 Tax=Metabacillus fastidiosus TaxID=1458 RepID=UPI002E1E9308|nr:YheC/YheD family protein [Metabacillus fastidiosus]